MNLLFSRQRRCGLVMLNPPAKVPERELDLDLTETVLEATKLEENSPEDSMEMECQSVMATATAPVMETVVNRR